MGTSTTEMSSFLENFARGKSPCQPRNGLLSITAKSEYLRFRKCEVGSLEIGPEIDAVAVYFDDNFVKD